MKSFWLMSAALIASSATAQTTAPSSSTNTAQPAAAAAAQATPQPATDAPTTQTPSTAQPSPSTGTSGSGTATTATSATTSTTPANSTDAVAAVVASDWGKYDGDTDGNLSKTEFSSWMTALRDQNPAQKAQVKDVNAWTTAAFTQADKDKSGTVSKTELQGFLKG